MSCILNNFPGIKAGYFFTILTEKSAYLLGCSHIRSRLGEKLKILMMQEV